MVSTARPNVPNDFVIEELCQTAVSIICRRDHPLTRLSSITARDLAKYRWIGNPPRTGIAVRFRALFEAEGIEPPPFTAQSELFELKRSLVMSGEFLALTVRSDFGHDYEHQGLVTLNKRVPNETRPIWLISRQNWKPTRLHETFVAVLREVTADKSPESKGAVRK
jgi:DNA-binding transcriptional LysR family regulator